MVENLPANAGDMSSIPGLGTKIPQAVEQLSPCAATTEILALEPVLCHERSHCNEMPEHRNTAGE